MAKKRKFSKGSKSPVERGELESAFKAKGFKLSMGKHRIWRFFIDGKTRTNITTTVSHGLRSKESTSAKFAASVCRQLQLTRSQLDELIECTLTHEDLKVIFGSRA